MKFNFHLASEMEMRSPIEVNTIEDLLKIVETYNESIVIGKSFFGNDEEQKYTIMVYDDYIE